MEFNNDWHFSPTAFYQPSQFNHEFHRPSNSMTYLQHPARHLARIAKPARRQSSPRGSVKRKPNSITALPTRTRSVIDRRPTYPQAQVDFTHMPSRPTSWHPMPSNQYLAYDLSGGDVSAGYLNAPYASAEINGVVTPLSLPIMDEPQIQDLATPLDELSGNDLTTYYPIWSGINATQPAYWPQQGGKLSSEFSFYPTQDDYVMDYNNMYNQFHATNIATAPPSPSFLPLQSHEVEEQLEALDDSTADVSEELVGMGLYDSPADVQSSLLGLGARPTFGARNSICKGLKLEDSFELPEGLEDDSEEAEPDAEDEDDDVEDQDPQPQTSTNIEMPSVTQHFAEQSFYLEHGYSMANPSTFGEPSYAAIGWQNPDYGTYGWI